MRLFILFFSLSSSSSSFSSWTNSNKDEELFARSKCFFRQLRDTRKKKSVARDQTLAVISDYATLYFFGNFSLPFTCHTNFLFSHGFKESMVSRVIFEFVVGKRKKTILIFKSFPHSCFNPTSPAPFRLFDFKISAAKSLWKMFSFCLKCKFNRYFFIAREFCISMELEFHRKQFQLFTAKVFPLKITTRDWKWMDR